jgi:cytoskeletal protein RodZ
MTVGNELRRAREAAGLSAEQISERTKIQLHKIEALENDDFERLPQGIYLDGIVRAYAHEVAIDVEPMVERVRAQRGQLAGDREVPFGAPIELHVGTSHTEPTAFDDMPVLDVPVLDDDPLSAFATEKDLNVAHVPLMREHRRSQRLGTVVPALTLLGALGIGFYFYQRGRETAEPVSYAENAVTQNVEIPSPPAEPSPSPTIPAQSEPIEPASSRDVTGSWRVATHVESSSLARYKGLKFGYDLQLQQDGDRVKGRGRKVTENGAGIRAGAQTPLTVSGTIDGDRLTLNFVERGTRRQTQGKFVLLVDDSGALRGRFSTSAARSSGRVEAHRVTTQ